MHGMWTDFVHMLCGQTLYILAFVCFVGWPADSVHGMQKDPFVHVCVHILLCGKNAITAHCAWPTALLHWSAPPGPFVGGICSSWIRIFWHRNLSRNFGSSSTSDNQHHLVIIRYHDAFVWSHEITYFCGHTIIVSSPFLLQALLLVCSDILCATVSLSPLAFGGTSFVPSTHGSFAVLLKHICAGACGTFFQFNFRSI